MTEEQIQKVRFEMRIAAIESFIGKIYGALLAASAMSEDEMRETVAEGLYSAGLESFGQRDPAISDLLAGEWQDALLKLSDVTVDTALEVRGRLSGRSKG